MQAIRKYPRTQHLEGSGLQTDDDLMLASWNDLVGQFVVVEEKLDGANCGLSFDHQGQLQLQSRGHYLTGGPRERQFDLLKSWARRYQAELWELLGDRYVLYGEWCYGKHSIFYTDLPHYLLEFDLFDHQTNQFLSTQRRQQHFRMAPWISSVPVLSSGILTSAQPLLRLIGQSRFISDQQYPLLIEAATQANLNPTQICHESDLSGLMEGLYLKIESADHVIARYKYVRPGFLQTVLDSGSHWMERPLIPNRLRPGVELW